MTQFNLGVSLEELIERVEKNPLMPETETNNTGLDLSKALRLGKDLQTLDIPINWAIKSLIPLESISLLHGRGGIGKTILSIAITDAISKGIPFMGLETTKRPAIYIDFENSLPVLVERIKRIGASEVLFWHATNEIRPPRLDSKEWTLYKELPQGAVLVFDTLRASQSRDENDSQHMALIMQRLKELRDLGFTIVLLHHTIKSNDKQYKGSTAIFDLADHVLSIHKVKRGNYATDEASENDEDLDEYCYRFGTRDKTRYEPFHIFMEFNTEKGYFTLAPDPDTETIEEIYNLLLGKEPLNQTQVYELVKKELNIKDKCKVRAFLKKGVGRYFEERKRVGEKAIYYMAKQKFDSLSLYTKTIKLLPENTEQKFSYGQTITKQKNPETLASATSFDSLATSQTIQTIAPKQGDNSLDDPLKEKDGLNYCKTNKTTKPIQREFTI